MRGRALFAIGALVAGTSLPAQAPAEASPGDVAKRIVHSLQRGRISWYGRAFAGRRTASGERFDPQAMTMAHRSLPLGTIVRVVNDDNGRSVTLRVNDRGPYHGDRVADVSRAASQRLGFVDDGVTDATLLVVWVPPAGDAPAG
jgi:rare lipoprotein A